MANLAVSDIRAFVGSKDFDISRDFYVALGWELVYDSEHIRVLELEGHCFYLQNYYQKEWCDNNMLHISVESVDDWYTHVKTVFSQNNFSQAARYGEAINDEGYGRVFHIWDPVGVLLHVAQFHEY